VEKSFIRKSSPEEKSEKVSSSSIIFVCGVNISQTVSSRNVDSKYALADLACDFPKVKDSERNIEDLLRSTLPSVGK
jgi:hypothetical protein